MYGLDNLPYASVPGAGGRPFAAVRHGDEVTAGAEAGDFTLGEVRGTVAPD